VLTESEVDVLAAALFEQHELGQPFRSIADRIPTVDDALSVQNALVALMMKKEHARVAGYKVSLTSQRMRDWLQIHEPCSGQVLSSRVHESGYEVRVSDFVRLAIEMEVCVILAQGMSGSCTPDDVRKNLRSVHCSYELVEDRGADLTRLDVKSLVSDNSWNAGIVLGPAGPLGLDLRNRSGWLRVNGVVTHEGNTAETIGGDPLNAVAWLAKHLGELGKAIEPGQPVMTGSIIPSQFIGAGNVLEFALEGLPSVQLRLI
jgi:2-keto-4-pentenoate hydratase